MCAPVCAIKMCTTHGCVCLHMGGHRDCNLVWYMGFPNKQVDSAGHDTCKLRKGCVRILQIILNNRILTYTGSKVTQNQSEYKYTWLYWGQNEKSKGGLDRDNPHFYLEFLSIRVWLYHAPAFRPVCF